MLRSSFEKERGKVALFEWCYISSWIVW